MILCFSLPADPGEGQGHAAAGGDPAPRPRRRVHRSLAVRGLRLFDVILP